MQEELDKKCYNANPINVSITTTPIDINEVTGIQLEFVGAAKYFPTPLTSSPPRNASQQDREQYQRSMDEYDNNLRQNIGANIMHLTNDTTRDTYWDSQFPELSSLPNPSRFSGTIQNITYSNGGEFDIGITVSTPNGTFGYGVGDTSYVFKNAVTVSPPEALLQIQNNNVITGIGWIGIGLPFILAGLIGLLEIVKKWALESENKLFACVKF